MSIQSPPVPFAEARITRLAEAKRRARYVSSFPRTVFEGELAADVLYLLRELTRLERAGPALPFEEEPR
jgi:hypothetical protein